MNKEANRVNTFVHPNWRLGWLNVKLMAASGLFYLGVADKTQCYFCKVDIFSWKQGDDVVEEHRRWSPSCRLLLRQHTVNVPIDASRLEEILPSPLLSLDIEKKTFTFVSDILMNLSNCNDSPSLVYSCMKSEDERRSTFLRHKMFVFHRDMLASSGLFYSSLESTIKCFSCGSKFKDVAEKNVSKIYKQHESASYCAFIRQKITQKMIQEPNDTCLALIAESNDNKLCKICYNMPMSVAFIPCGHVAACLRCGSFLDKCPICNIKHCGLLRLYFS